MSPNITCSTCKEDYSKHEKYSEYPRDDLNLSEVECVKCSNKTLQWSVQEHDFVYQVWFDFAHQCWRTKDGNYVDETQPECDDWSHVCNICSGPAKITSIDAYGENHKCLNCTHTFRVS